MAYGMHRTVRNRSNELKKRKGTVMSEQNHRPVEQDTVEELSEPYAPLFDGKEIVKKPLSGAAVILLPILVLATSIGLFAVGIYGIGQEKALIGGLGIGLGILLFIAFWFAVASIKSVKPNEAAVFTLFGRYYGTMKEPGLYLVNPFVSAVDDPTTKTTTLHAKGKDEAEGVELATKSNRVSLKMRALNNERQKVNDLLGNPIVLETVVFWHVVDPTKALFNVDDYGQYLSTQCDSVVRNIARLYPYDNLEYDDVEDSEKTLMGSSLMIADEMKRALREKAAVAGIEVEEVRISHLAYSEEIAAAMLQRQQASAVVSARSKIVDGAVGMVQMALDQLDEKNIVNLDEERKAQMVSNLLVVLCASKEISPVVNSGSIY